MSVGRPRPCQPAIAAFVVIAVAAYACGGGGGTGSATTTTGGSTTTSGTTGTTGTTTTGGTTSNIQVTVDPQNTTCYTSAQVQFTAVLTGTPNQAVTWSVDGLNRGTIDQNGLFTAVGFPTNAFVRATSVADPAKYGLGGVVIKNRASIEYFGSPNGIDGLPFSEVYDMSDDGLTAVGKILVAGVWKPAYWTKADGWVQLALPPGVTTGLVQSTAGNANWMVGYTESNNYVTRFSKSGFVQQLLDQNGQKFSAEYVACSHAGNVVVGGPNDSINFGWRWRENIGLNEVPLTFIGALSVNGGVVGGASGGGLAATWHDDTGVVLFFDVNNPAAVLALNGNGTTSAGNSASGQFFRSGGTVYLAGAGHKSMSGNGAWLTGTDSTSAFRWSTSTGRMYVKDLLTSNGLLTDISSMVFDGRTWVSDDARKFMGECGDFQFGARKFYYAKLP